ncbi:hypothetical protein RhiJN_13825 [Ceratobasidium sp. AG-Ba]|nr:hypothetical protein RhiJN_13825 [Ceratobasidium sp. AG-Ba]QRW14384.1 hypothetical protein RhiLY_13383 [Ceratobasidium sp. AG-Ba]
MGVRSNAGPQSPIKTLAPSRAQASYNEDRSSEPDASSDKNDARLEKPGDAMDESEDVEILDKYENETKKKGEIILVSSDEEEDTTKVAKKHEGEKDVSESEEEGGWVRKTGRRRTISSPFEPSLASQGEYKPRRIVRGKPRVDEERDKSDEDIMDGLDEDSVIDSRLRSAPMLNIKTTRRRNTLARLNRRRLGHDTPPVRPESESFGSQDENESTQTTYSYGGASDSGSFIDNDDDELNATALPDEFSMRTRQPLAYEFKVVIQLFVHLALMRPEERRPFRETKEYDQYSGVFLRRLRRRLDGLKESLVASSAWTAQFKKALDTHPELATSDLGYPTPGCEACRISSRVSTWQGTLSGDYYDQVTFELITKPEDGDDDNDEELPTTFTMGKYCEARVRCYHDFTHWEWKVFETICAEIEQLRATPLWDKPEDIINWLHSRGIVKEEQDRLEGLMEEARKLEYKIDGDDEEYEE